MSQARPATNLDHAVARRVAFLKHLSWRVTDRIAVSAPTGRPGMFTRASGNEEWPYDLALGLQPRRNP